MIIQRGGCNNPPLGKYVCEKPSGEQGLRGHNLVLFSIGHNVLLYTEFKIRYLNNLKLFSVGIKELIEPTVLWKKTDVFLFFCFKALSSETDFLVTLGDFTVKNAKFGREICI